MLVTDEIDSVEDNDKDEWKWQCSTFYGHIFFFFNLNGLIICCLDKWQI